MRMGILLTFAEHCIDYKVVSEPELVFLIDSHMTISRVGHEPRMALG
jgi:hypothetical protein